MSGHNPFGQMVAFVTGPKSTPLTITREQYSIWKRQYTLDGLRGVRYGKSFCDYFGITDNLLLHSLGVQAADAYIEETYVVENTHEYLD